MNTKCIWYPTDEQVCPKIKEFLGAIERKDQLLEAIFNLCMKTDLRELAYNGLSDRLATEIGSLISKNHIA